MAAVAVREEHMEEQAPEEEAMQVGPIMIDRLQVRLVLRRWPRHPSALWRPLTAGN